MNRSKSSYNVELTKEKENNLFQEDELMGTNAQAPINTLNKSKSKTKLNNTNIICQECGHVKANRFHVCNLTGTEHAPIGLQRNNLNNKSTLLKDTLINANLQSPVPSHKLGAQLNKNKKILSDSEIEKKVEDYKRKLNSDLLKVLSEEKFKEEERELLYNRTTNQAEKKRLEKIIAMERAQGSERIMKINE